MSDLWIVVPAAGESRRFKEAGYTIPKPFLMIDDEGLVMTMIGHVLYDINHYEKILVGLSNLAPDDFEFPSILIENSIGQADTVYRMLSCLPQEDSVLVLDCDMILEADDIQKMMDFLKNYDVVIAVAESFNPNASRVDQVPFPTRFVEKEPISQYAIVGARAFKNIGLLKKALERTLDRYKKIGQEPYLSVAINHYPGTKYAHQITKYTDWGTPEAVKSSGAKIV